MKTYNRILGALLGTIAEYYDHSLYGFSATIIAAKFFPNDDHFTALMNTFAVYAVAYFAKPLGSLVFGRIGDRYGRKITLNITILGIAVPTAVIGMLPEYHNIGVWSIVILLGCRLLQGFFVGAEYDGAAIYVIEHLGQRWRYTASAITRTTGVVGLLLGIASTNFFNSHIFPVWGWRIPFLLSIPFALITVYYRRQLVETPEFEDAMIHREYCNMHDAHHLSSLNNNYIILAVILLAGGFGVTYQVAVIFMKQYLPMILPQTQFVISTFSILLVLCFGAIMPIAGFCADRFGVMRVVRYSTICAIIGSVLLCLAIKYVMINLALASALIIATSVAPSNALAHGMFVKNIPTNKRYFNISFGHTIGSMLMSGSAGYVCLKLMQVFNSTLIPIIYLSIFSILTYCTVLWVHLQQFNKLIIDRNLVVNS